MKILTFAIMCLLPIAVSMAQIITVDDEGTADFDNIQDAINHSQNGYTIIVEPGIYNENIHFNSKAVTLTSSNPHDPNIVASTIITSSSGYTVSFDFNEGHDSVLTGFTITGWGIHCYGTSPTILKNIISNCIGYGIHGEDNAAPVVEDNTITSSSWQGIYLCDGPITNNVISKNRGGIASCNGPITGNLISENIENDFGRGGGLSFCNGQIIANRIEYNYATYNGGALYECRGNVAYNIIIGNTSVNAGGALSNCHGVINNNIIAGNKSNSGGGLFACFNHIYNNTIVGNYAQFGGAMQQCQGYVYNNIIAFNKAASVAGISGGSLNSYNLFWANQGGNFGSGAFSGPGDIIVDPNFAQNGYWDNNGTSDDSDATWIDGDYHLKSQIGRWDPNSLTWVEDEVTSPAIDAADPNSPLVAELWPHGKLVNIGVYGNTEQASMSPSDAGNIADLNYDDWVDYQDMDILTGKWLEQDVLLAEDLDRDGQVNLTDLAIMTANWQMRPPPPQPPTPNPMTWQTEPYAVSAYSIAMLATAATSTDGSGVEYYFQSDTPGGHDSSWQDEPNYTDSDLSPATSYSYSVKARNKANLLETQFSQSLSATTETIDTTPPNPNPAQWQTEPYPVPPSSISMIAATASDPSGVEYYFQCTSNPLYSSNWQDSPEYTATSVSKGTHSFVVRARDKSPYNNTTGNSTEIAVDLQPPSPDPMQWATGGEPDEVYRGGGTLTGYWAQMTAAEASDSSGQVQYFFECTTRSAFSSDWQDSTSYEVQVGRKDQLHRFRVKARDIYGNETAYSPELPAH